MLHCVFEMFGLGPRIECGLMDRCNLVLLISCYWSLFKSRVTCWHSDVIVVLTIHQLHCSRNT